MTTRPILSGPTPAALLNEHERRLRNAPPEHAEIVPVMLELIESGRKALQEHRWADLALELHQLGAVGGWLAGMAESSRSRASALDLLRERMPGVIASAKRQMYAEAGSKGGRARARTEKRKEVWNRWRGEAILKRRDNPEWTTQEIYEAVGKEFKQKPSTIRDRFRKMGYRVSPKVRRKPLPPHRAR